MSDDLWFYFDSEIEKRYILDILIYIKQFCLMWTANCKDLVTFRININFIQIIEINMHYEIKIFFEMLQ